MRRNYVRSVGTAAAVAFCAFAVMIGTTASGTEKIGKQEGLECTSCHDKPGSKLLTDQGKYFETRRTLEGYAELKDTFGACTNCHERKPGSKKLTRQGREFQKMVDDMAGLAVWMEEHHPVPKATGRE